MATPNVDKTEEVNTMKHIHADDKAKEAGNIAYWVDGGVLHSSLYWIDSLDPQAIYRKKPKEIAGKKFVEQICVNGDSC